MHDRSELGAGLRAIAGGLIALLAMLVCLMVAMAVGTARGGIQGGPEPPKPPVRIINENYGNGTTPKPGTLYLKSVLDVPDPVPPAQPTICGQTAECDACYRHARDINCNPRWCTYLRRAYTRSDGVIVCEWVGWDWVKTQR